MKAISLAACIPLGCTSGGWNCYKHPASGLPRTQTSSRPTGQFHIFRKSARLAKAAAAVVGGALAVVAVPTVLGAMGFTGAGIAASSLAAKMMSSAAIANGGGVAAGSLVATLQSVGSAGLSLSSRVLLGSAGFDLVSPVVGL
ncbi:interferon alpha-inducible protein 27-like protein 2 isoform X3 [Balaenoptera acutorostrata]|uniref:Interferon alpha-inducible protein 27-like protein 2 isoform X3 n=1 Tax=Balaenoptera acutorostrata TaxID=9767 RepID=A0ABM3T6Y8_BALAC|nr:interferon alpha-inducible protein 27-like protein 2 isoform X3 [Balaenoptera acutorostrata]XP_057397868.1 interferon alpha-inducible protein 27-like protein 2 isoform X3 [Balaenoptera acutorostrata]